MTDLRRNNDLLASGQLAPPDSPALALREVGPTGHATDQPGDSTRTAQYFSSAILATGSSAGFVSSLAAAST